MTANLHANPGPDDDRMYTSIVAATVAEQSSGKLHHHEFVFANSKFQERCHRQGCVMICQRFLQPALRLGVNLR